MNPLQAEMSMQWNQHLKRSFCFSLTKGTYYIHRVTKQLALNISLKWLKISYMYSIMFTCQRKICSDGSHSICSVKRHLQLQIQLGTAFMTKILTNGGYHKFLFKSGISGNVPKWGHVQWRDNYPAGIWSCLAQNRSTHT